MLKFLFSNTISSNNNETRASLRIRVSLLPASLRPLPSRLSTRHFPATCTLLQLPFPPSRQRINLLPLNLTSLTTLRFPPLRGFPLSRPLHFRLPRTRTRQLPNSKATAALEDRTLETPLPGRSEASMKLPVNSLETSRTSVSTMLIQVSTSAFSPFAVRSDTDYGLFSPSWQFTTSSMHSRRSCFHQR